LTGTQPLSRKNKRETQPQRRNLRKNVKELGAQLEGIENLPKWGGYIKRAYEKKTLVGVPELPSSTGKDAYGFDKKSF